MHEVAITLLLALHLLCVNAAAGGPLVAAWLDWCGARGSGSAVGAARYLAAYAVSGLLVGGLMGLIIGALQWTADYRSLWLGPLSYKLHGAAIEAVFSLVLMLGWWLWLPTKPGGKLWAAVVRGFIAFLASTNLLYHFPILFSVATRLHDQGQTSGEVIRGSGFRQLMVIGETPALAVHVALASVAVAGVLLLGMALRLMRRGDPAADAIARWGGRWALAPTLAQLPVGLWTLAVLSPQSQSQIMGSTAVGVVLFLTALLAALWLTRELASVALGDTARPVLIRSMTALLVTVVLMTALQRQTRPSRPTSLPSHGSRLHER